MTFFLQCECWDCTIYNTQKQFYNGQCPTPLISAQSALIVFFMITQWSAREHNNLVGKAGYYKTEVLTTTQLSSQLILQELLSLWQG